jgi:SAM-dependent methyltransferase
METAETDAWLSGQPYERYMGRWSRPLASAVLEWLAPGPQLAWGDVGCGTGALASAIVASVDPASLFAVDSSEAFVAQARRRLNDSRIHVQVADATKLPWPTGCLDASVSGLVLNFVPDHESMVREMARVTRPGGTVAAYVWDYADGMQMIRHFWDAAAQVDPASRRLDEGARFPVCQRDALKHLFERAGLDRVEATGIAIPTKFESFDDYWSPFLGRTGPAPAYLASVSDGIRNDIRHCLESRLAPHADGKISLAARAWAAKGTHPR